MWTARNQSGFTYLALIFAVAILGTALAATGVVWHRVQQREKEAELLHVGKQFRRAIALYYARTPGPVKRYPRSLEDLLEDKRFSIPHRYLRKLYRDPISGRAEWGLVKAADGGIIGVHSLSDAAVIKTANFGLDDRTFADKTKYSEWQFVYAVPVAPAAPRSPSPPGAATPTTLFGTP